MENLKKNKGTYKSEYYLMNRIRMLEYQKAYHFRTNTPEKILRQRKYNAEYYKKNKHKWNKRPANKSVEEGGCCLETTLAQKLRKTRLADHSLSRRWLLRQELLPHWAPGDEANNNLFWQAVCVQCQVANGCNAQAVEGLTRLDV